MSDDGAHALSVIAFIGCVFSPFYARARRRAANDVPAAAHCAMNVALYRQGGGGQWAMTEHPGDAVGRTAHEWHIGPNRLAWQADALHLRVDERSAPLRRPLRGTLRLQPKAVMSHSVALDAAGRHHWRPVAPCARIEVAMDEPRLHWQGQAYLDSNLGSAPLEDDFVRWDWLRAPLPDGRTAVLYDGQRRDRTPFTLSQAYTPDGRVEAYSAPPAAMLPPSAWRVARGARCDAGAGVRTVQVLEDGPFYARSLLATRLNGDDVVAVHESLSLDRFRSRWVQRMLPFRMRRPGAFPLIW